jgi:cob(I)alamin adenosyltransferase
VRLTKIYTKVGDKGSTGLANGQMVSKASARIESYGTVDELNAVVGLLRDEVLGLSGPVFVDLAEKLRVVQNELFDLGGELATPIEVLNTERQQVVDVSSITRLEREMDQFNESLEPLANFVLPGGHKANSAAHLARTVCRRAERRIVALTEEETLREECRIYLNRLSDWFFVLSRIISKSVGCPENLWQQQKKK